MRKLACLLLTSILAACSSRPPAPQAAVIKPIRAIAVVQGDALASGVGGELVNQGFRTFEVPSTQAFTPAALQALAGRGVDGVLTVTSTKGRDMFPETTMIRLVSTQTGATVADIKWSNANPRKDAVDTARDVVRLLLQAVPKP